MLHLKSFSLLIRLYCTRCQLSNGKCRLVPRGLLSIKPFNRQVLLKRAYKAASTYIEEMYNSWLRDPTSVHRSWDAYFRSAPSIDADNEMAFVPNALAKLEAVSPIDKAIDEHLLVYELIKTYQSQGHKIANLNPLESLHSERNSVKALCPELSFEPMLDKEYRLPNNTYISHNSPILPLCEIIKRLEDAYCHKIGLECSYLNSLEECNWLKKHFETPGALKTDSVEQRLILTRLIKTVGFESFLADKFPTEKRFSIEGCETLIPALRKIIDVSSESGVESIVIGMPQRGRFNTIANVLKKPLRQIFSLFTGSGYLDDDINDIKYCYGTCIERLNRVSLRPIRLSVIASPSHAEAFVPVVQGRALAEQFLRGDETGKQVMPILIHEDASFYGQGIVSETMNLTALPNFSTHGTINIVLSDQTTNLKEAQCTNVARAANAPIIHVNADDPEAVVYASKIAANWRIHFQKDIVLHLVGYRRPSDLRFVDEVVFKQPLLHQKILKHIPCLSTYSQKLMGAYVITPDEIKKDVQRYKDECEEAFNQAKKEIRFQKWFWIDAPWTDFFETKIPFKILPTGVRMPTLIDLANKFLSPPKNKPDFVLHKELHRVLADRKALVDSGNVDWAIGEALAFGTLLNDGVHVRLSGQDVERGMLSQRHHVLHHMLEEKVTHNLLQHLYPNQAIYSVANSSVSEQATLGFEVGYATTNPNTLVLWEAQYGDFSNAAQSVIDDLISSGQSNLVRQCGIVLLLPHGVEGMGPEFSSARLERFLQMASDDPDHFLQDINNFPFCQLRDTNWIVANCTTPANYFHLLRRQIAMPFRKPLVLMTPKSLLRHKSVLSSFEEMDDGTEFQRLIPDQTLPCRDPREVKKLIFCSGRIYYDLAKKRTELNLEAEIAIARIEQLCPFPFDLVKKQAELFETADLIWAQEEHKNQGAWSYVSQRFQTAVADNRFISYVGRPVSANTATTSKKQYSKEAIAILNEALNVYSFDSDNCFDSSFVKFTMPQLKPTVKLKR